MADLSPLMPAVLDGKASPTPGRKVVGMKSSQLVSIRDRRQVIQSRANYAAGPKIPEEKEKGGDPSQSRKVVPLPKVLSSVSDADEQKGRYHRLCAWCSGLSENWRFTVLTTMLTVYALFGDDFRLAATKVTTDVLFNILTVFCLAVFSFEIGVNCLGQDEYFLGFFFLLDLGSTITLTLDLTWVGNALFCGSNASNARSSKSAQQGAQASRTVRVVRLMRLVKLYKTYRHTVEMRREQERKLAAAAAAKANQVAPGEEDQHDEEEDEPHLEDSNVEDVQPTTTTGGLSTKEGQTGTQMDPKKGPDDKETRVGKKLSDMTTRRVIILVLFMLFILPLLTLQGVGLDDFKTGGSFGADVVYDRFRSWCPMTNYSETPWCYQGLSTPANAQRAQRYLTRAWYEDAFLNYIYRYQAGGVNAFRLQWVGVASNTLYQTLRGNVYDYLGRLAQLNQAHFLGAANVIPAAMLSQTWDTRYARYGETSLPTEVKALLSDPWNEKCLGYAVGVRLVTDATIGRAGVCSLTQELRCNEMELVVQDHSTDGEFATFQLIFAFDARAITQLEAGLNMLQTLFICLAVGCAVFVFQKDANELLLQPIERMIAKMETIKDNPLEAMRLGDLEYRREEVERQKRKDHMAGMSPLWKMIYWYQGSTRSKEPMETVMLEKTIIKLGGLLALGFGEAGAEIIGTNMKGGSTTTINPVVAGQKVDAIIGFCNIRHFTYCTEVLKEKVMLFVNQVGEIVHGCVDNYYGAPNRNNGDAFLIIWRLAGASPEKQTKLADMAIMSYIKILAEINKSRVLATYQTHPGLLQRMPKFRVEMGFGLHCGWAIEGAIGSEFKIDASYLSPNVNVAQRLEAATVHFGVWVLVSHFMVKVCSPEMGAVCRLIDHVTVKGCRQPVRIHTIDLDSTKLQIVQSGPEKIIRNRFKIRQLREARKTEKWSEEFRVWDHFKHDEDIIIMREGYSKEFFQRFAMAYRNYEAGEWLAARDMLLTCHYRPLHDVGTRGPIKESMWPVDGPTVTLLHFMERQDFVAPVDWPGHRKLDMI